MEIEDRVLKSCKGYAMGGGEDFITEKMQAQKEMEKQTSNVLKIKRKKSFVKDFIKEVMTRCNFFF